MSDFVYAAVADGGQFVLYAPTGSVMLQRGEPWFADDPFVLARPDLFSSTPPVVRSTTGRLAPEPQPVGKPKPRKAARRG